MKVTIWCTDLLPKTLTVSQNGGVSVYPNVEGDLGSVFYQIGSDRMAVSGPILLNDSDTIHFFHCLNNLTLTIGNLLLLE